PNVPVYLIFAGPGWGTRASPSASAQAIEDATDSLLSGPYLSRLASYRADLGHATFGLPGDPGHRAAWDAAGLPNGFSKSDLHSVIDAHIGNGDLPPTDATSTEGLYIVITPPGVMSDDPNAGGFHDTHFRFD